MKDIDIKLPKRWNDLNLNQLKIVANEVIKRGNIIDNDIRKMLIGSSLFFKLGDLKIIRIEKDMESSTDLCYLVSRDSVEFRIRTFQIQYWIEKQLAWLFDAPTLLDIPADLICLSNGKKYFVPPEMMNGFSWRRFRLACDFMEQYASCANAMIRLLNQKEPSINEVKKANVEVNLSKARFLSILLTYERNSGEFTIDRIERYEKDLLLVSDEWFQIILFWWESTMNRLMQIYPRVFSGQDLKANRIKDPMTVYSRTIATLEKYLNIPEDALNNETYTNILQHLDDIVKQNEEIDDMKRR